VYVPIVYTIGHKGKPLRQFIGELRSAGIDAVIDVRLRNTSHLLGYTKQDDLSFLLTEGFGIAYEHCPDLTPSPEIMDAYRQDHDWSRYVARFRPLLAGRPAIVTGQRVLKQYAAPCLLCAEQSAERCHRRLVAEHWAAELPDITIVHL
jgi:uncharacterized protein (DUF488 family)